MGFAGFLDYMLLHWYHHSTVTALEIIHKSLFKELRWGEAPPFPNCSVLTLNALQTGYSCLAVCLSHYSYFIQHTCENSPVSGLIWPTQTHTSLSSGTRLPWLPVRRLLSVHIKVTQTGWEVMPQHIKKGPGTRDYIPVTQDISPNDPVYVRMAIVRFQSLLFDVTPLFLEATAWNVEKWGKK